MVSHAFLTHEAVIKTFLALALVVISSFAFGATTLFPSGLLKDYEADAPTREEMRSERAATDEFLRREFRDIAPARWRLQRTLRDESHTHALYDLFVGERRVENRFLNVHYNRAGFVEYASSSLARVVDEPTVRDTGARRAALEAQIRDEVTRAYGTFDGRLVVEPVIWLDAKERGVAAFDVSLVTFNPTRHRDYVVAEDDFRVLETKRVARFADPTNKVFLSSPYPNQAASPPTSVTLTGLDTGTRLSSAFIHVLREQLTGDPNQPPVQQEVDPTHDFSADADFSAPTFSDPHDQASYNYTCYSTDPTKCPLQGFDAVNVFFHINNYRRKLKGYYDTLGTAPVFKSDPLTVLINAMSVEILDSDGKKITSNNAAYIPKSCSKSLDRCLIFLRPEKLSSTLCGIDTPFYDLAREAVVAVHEFQHYVTDMTTGIVSSSSSVPDVGDALHEGYSDYFGASHVSDEAGVDVTKVGEYAFQKCPVIVRDLGTLRVFPNDSSDQDPHKSGLSWASGLWKLRKEFQPSPQTMDLIALKSQFFLSPTPGFIEAIEALVRADKALNNGVHVARIRELFYNEVKFTGSAQTGIFSDTGSHIADVGFSSCGAVHSSRDAAPAPVAAFLAVIATWLTATVALGRRKARQR